MEVEHHQTGSPLVGQNLVTVVVATLHRLEVEEALFADKLYHIGIETVEARIFEQLIVGEVPLPAGILARPAVALAGEVDPLGMAELVAHEIEVAPAARGERNETDHLVQGYAPVYQQVLRALVHRPVHILVDQAEDDGLVAYERLVVALGIGDRVLVGALVGELPPDAAHAPLLVAEFLDPLDPMVGDAHRHPEVEAHAAGLDPADVLGDRDGLRVQLVDQLVGQRQVADGVLVHALVEIIAVVAEILAQAVVPVDHARDPVEAETVQVVFLHPVFAVRKQEVLDFILAVVEAAGIPGRVEALRALVEVEVLAAVQPAQALQLVADGVGVDDVHDHGDAAPVRIVHERLELLGRAETRAQGEEIGDLIPEGAVVRVLLQGHDLQDVVAEFLHARKHVPAEILERGHLLLLAAHPDVAFIDQRMGPPPGLAPRPLVGNGRIPDLGREKLGLRVLDNAGHIGRQALPAPARPLDPELVELPVVQEHLRDAELPIATAHGLEGIGLGALPVVAVAGQVDTRGVGRPLAEHPVATLTVQRIVDVVVDRRGERTLAREFAAVGEDVRVTCLDGVLVGLQPRVSLIDLLGYHRLSICSLAVRRYSRQRAISSSERLMQRSISSSGTAGSSTRAAIFSSSAIASL